MAAEMSVPDSKIQYQLADDVEFLLLPGDTIRFDRSRPHRIYNPLAAVAQFLLVVTPPSR